jgi:hypothetical protein
MQRTATYKCWFEGSSAPVRETTIESGEIGVGGYAEWRRERQMSDTIEERSQGHSLLEVEYDVGRREVERRELARDVEAQHERLHTLRAIVLEELTKQRRVAMPRWPSGPKVDASLVDEDEWWSKMLGKKKAA